MHDPTHDITTTSTPCCAQVVRLYVPTQQAIHLYERTCKSCGRQWTFASDREPYRDGWGTSYFVKLGKPTVPAVREVLLGREDGWINDETFERRALRETLSSEIG